HQQVAQVNLATGALNHQAGSTLNVDAPIAAAPTLGAPADGSTGVATTPAFTWNAVSGATGYDIQVATDPAFTSIVASATGLTGTGYTPGSALSSDTVYYWRVYAVNACGNQASTIHAFRTAAAACNTYASIDVPKRVPPSGTFGTTTSVVTVPSGGGTITDVNVNIGQLTHTYDADLDIYISHPDSTQVELSTDNGGSGDNYVDTVFDDEAPTPITAGSAPFTGSFRPEGLLGTLDSKGPDGTWTMTVIDDAIFGSGVLTAWSLTICTEASSVTADYGDLAGSYGVAWHTGDGSLRLGPTWTADTTFSAGTDVDDGVAFLGNFTPGQNATVRVNVQGTPANGRWLRLWFDWNDNDVFDSDELVYNNSVSDGNNDLTVAVPSGTGSAVPYRARLYDSAVTPTAPEVVDSMSYGAAAGGEVEDDLSPVPLSVTLAVFYAEQVDDFVRMTWETTSELGNSGFNLYRGTSPDGWDRQLNQYLIPSQSPGSSSGFVYTWDDYDGLVPGTTYYYWLEDVDVYGATTMHGPVSEDFAGPTAVTLGEMRAGSGTAGPPLAAAMLAPLLALAGVLAVRRWRGMNVR
ncbi:MAG: GEVED domain-containing protein, partial [Anaerolineae bacterium]